MPISMSLRIASARFGMRCSKRKSSICSISFGSMRMITLAGGLAAMASIVHAVMHWVNARLAYLAHDASSPNRGRVDNSENAMRRLCEVFSV